MVARRAAMGHDRVSSVISDEGSSLQRQNEPSLAVSSRNALHLMAGANDYRKVDLPLQDTVPGEGNAGDAWLGLFSEAEPVDRRS